MRTLWTWIVLLVWSAAPIGAADSTAKTRAEPVFARMAVLGASVSAGFGLEIETGAPTSLADVLDAAATAEHDPVLNGADLLFFVIPEEVAAKSVAKALEARATLVVAVDFLFWFGYGEVANEEERSKRLAAGLAFL